MTIARPQALPQCLVLGPLLFAGLLGGGCVTQSASSVTAPRPRPQASTEAPILIEVHPTLVTATWSGATRYFVKGGCQRDGTRQPYSTKGAKRLIRSTVDQATGPIQVRVAEGIDDTARRAVTEVLDDSDRGYAVARIPTRAPDHCPRRGTKAANPPMPGQPRVGTSSVARIRPNLTKPEISGVIRAQLSRFKDCYEEQLKVRPSAVGGVTVWFLIGPDGKVVRVELLENTVDSLVAQCVANTTANLQFPPPRGAGVAGVTYPFFFSSR